LESGAARFMTYIDNADFLKLPSREARLLIADRIKQLRINSGLSQDDIAQHLNISQSTYSRMERGILSPDCAQIRVISGLYGASILWLLGMPNFVVNAAKH
jgi:transcriptional regulator with XRE-family HTH domain